MYRLLFFALTFLLPLQGISQGLHKNTVKLNLSGLLTRHFQVAWEHPSRNKNRTFDFQFGIQFEKLNNYNVFRGNLSTNYLLTQYDSFLVQGNSFSRLNTPVWRYDEDSKPLPNAPEMLPAYTAYLKFGYRSYLNNPNRRLRFFVQPGIALAVESSYGVEDKFNLKWEKESTYQSIASNRQLQITKRYRFYEQQRQMRIDNQIWYVGLHYDAGVRLRVWKKLMIEAQLLSGLNITRDDETIIRTDLVKQYNIGYAINAGWQF